MVPFCPWSEWPAGEIQRGDESENTLTAANPGCEELGRCGGRARRTSVGHRLLPRILRGGLRQGARMGVAGRTAGPLPERYANEMQISACEPAPAVGVRPRSVALSVVLPRARSLRSLPLAHSVAGPLTPAPLRPAGTRLTGSRHRRVCSRRRSER